MGKKRTSRDVLNGKSRDGQGRRSMRRVTRRDAEIHRATWKEKVDNKAESTLLLLPPPMLLLFLYLVQLSFVRSNWKTTTALFSLPFSLFSNRELRPKSLRRWESPRLARRTSLGGESTDPCRTGRRCCSTAPISWRRDGPAAISNARPLGRYRPPSANRSEMTSMFDFHFWGGTGNFRTWPQLKKSPEMKDRLGACLSDWAGGCAVTSESLGM